MLDDSRSGPPAQGGDRSDLVDRIKQEAARNPERAYRDLGYDKPLTRVGHDLVGPCPFHEDRKPSFHITTTGEYAGCWKCFGCGRGGSIVDYYLETLGGVALSYPLVIELAGKLGISTESAQRRQWQEPEATYDYQSEDGAVLFQVVRFPQKRFAQRRPDEQPDTWIWNLQGVERVLYGLPRLRAHPDAIVIPSEGEKDADEVNRLADQSGEADTVVAVCNPGGAVVGTHTDAKWLPRYTEALRDRDVALFPDNDDTGRSHVENVAAALAGTARTIRVVPLPDVPESGDLSDYLEAHSIYDLLTLAIQGPLWQPVEPREAEEAAAQSEMTGGQSKRSQADRLVELVEASTIELFRDQFGEPQARGRVDGHWETWSLGSRVNRCRRWLATELWLSERKVPGPQAITAALNVIEARACAGPMIVLHNRVAAHEDSFFYDMSDDSWRAVKITAGGWSLVNDPPPLFWRYSHQQAQVEPDPAGDLLDLLGFINVRDAGDQLLILVYLVGCLVPGYPHPILVSYGPQGSAKTTFLRVLQRVIDPSIVEVMSFPHDSDDLAPMLANHWAPYFDNVSYLPDWLSDALCRASTGQGLPRRRLYTDRDEVIFLIKHCVGLTGINAAPTHSDLLDRCLFFGLPQIPDNERRTEAAFWSDFEAQRPALVGGAFNALAKAMELYPRIDLPEVSRMADFAHWGCAIAQALGSSQAQFLTAYKSDIERRHEEAVRANPVAEMITALLKDRLYWNGTASDLLIDLTNLAKEQRVSTAIKFWPQSAHTLVRALNRVIPNLEAEGYVVSVGDRVGKKGTRMISLERPGTAEESEAT